MTDDDDDGRTCPVCGGMLEVLGKLGRVVWWRCRACGIHVSTSLQPSEDDGAGGAFEEPSA